MSYTYHFLFHAVELNCINFHSDSTHFYVVLMYIIYRLFSRYKEVPTYFLTQSRCSHTADDMGDFACGLSYLCTP